MTTTKPMTPQMFLQKAMQKKALASVQGFLDAHKDWLVTGQLSNVTSPIIRQYVQKEIEPASAFKSIVKVVSENMLVENVIKESSVSGSYVVTCYKKIVNEETKQESEVVLTRINKLGDEVEISQGFEQPQRADNWAITRLVEDCPPEAYAKIVSSVSNKEWILTRARAMSIFFTDKKKKVGPKPPSTSRLGFGVKVHGDRCHFSHG